MASSTSNQPENDEDLFWEGILNFVDNYEQEIDQEMGRHIVGNLVDIPKLNSLVYYFPQGHMEYVQQDVLHPVDYGSFLCRVANVSFYADLETDQVFVKFLLEPWITDDNSNPNSNPNPNPSPIQMGGNDNNDIVSFVKVLSNFDVSNVGKLLVTNAFRECIFSQFSRSIKQYISVNDIHGKIWEIMFQSLGFSSHSTSLSCGWYDFVKTKNLRAGDSIVFMLKKSTNEYFVGIRRAVLNKPISVKDVENAVEKVRNMMSFEVVYYPNLGLPEFVVPKEKVDAALHVHWRRKMPVKIAYEDLRCINYNKPVKRWFYGYLLNDVNLEMDGFSPNSSWRMLQVQWNERPNILMNMPNMSNMEMKMSPWEVEVLQPSYNEREIDQEMGRHIVGNLVDIPKPNSLVYYFPQGHMEYVQQDVLHPVDYGSFLCRVANVSFYADPQTDQVFVKFLLEPRITNNNSNPNQNPNPNLNPNQNPSPIQMGGNDNNDIVSFVKVLTYTDVSNVGNLVVTNAFRECIFSQFPNDIKQYILVNDIHDKIWEIMFNSLGYPSRSTRLTYGWYDFVKTKNLRAGDSIVLMLKKSTNEYYVGIRRAVLNKPISVKDVEDAIEKVRNMKSFEVVYYPNLGLREFVVPKEKVDAGLHVHWRR